MVKRTKKGETVRAARAGAAPVASAPVATAPVPEATRPARAPRISVLERRLVDPNQRSSAPISLKDAGMTVRWVNSAIEGRYHRAVHEQGWEPVRKDELADANEIADLVDSPDGVVRRGERGKEVLMKMPRDVCDRIQDRKVEVRKQRARSSSRQKEELLTAVAGRHGPEAADYIGRHIKGEIIESTETVTS